jgi:hypothetical protein
MPPFILAILSSVAGGIGADAARPIAARVGALFAPRVLPGTDRRPRVRQTADPRVTLTPTVSWGPPVSAAHRSALDGPRLASKLGGR